ncbi:MULTISPECIES: low temperature requirement protein A [Streptococcus]|uniref:low temperature requirement protein A n=1 Tax=Streptococcus sp. UMB0029 TaxID=2069308 RepID=UPI000C8041B1|nr:MULTISPECIES: low temperature requirement protein A [Streptococcus]MDK7322339.1 low temperature requirement protein A [Streptococcus mitis]PMB99914.1 hypothetical protein CJ239_09605 [Streptococcus sp. UMB0029]
MTTLVKHKRVNYSELFYDLVFVFAISKVTALIHHLHNGILTWNSLLDFFMSVLLLINAWMIQTVYTNRYGKNSLFNMLIMFINMGLLLFISNLIKDDWQQYFHYVCWAIGTLTLTLFFQYLVEFFKKSTDNVHRESIKGFLWITGLRSLEIYLAALLPIFIGLLMMTVSMSFLLNPETNLLFATSFFYIGIGLFQAAVLANGPYNKHYLRYSKSYYCVQATLYLAALILSLIFASNPIIVVSITTILALAIAIHSIYFYMTQTKKHSTPYWELF